MEPVETASNQSQAKRNVSASKSRYKFKKVLDGRKQPVRGLWLRNGRFYARLTVENDDGTRSVRWVSLVDQERNPVATQAQAVAEYMRLQTQKADNDLPVLRRTPTFAAYADDYLAFFDKVKDAKRPATIQKEKGALKLWKEEIGGFRLDKIRRFHINKFIEKRQADGISGRTVNLDIIALRNVLKKAIDDGWLRVLPTENLRPLKWTPRKRELVTEADIKKLCKAAIETSKNGKQFADYVKLLAYSGARRNEALRLRWPDVDWKNSLLTIGSDGLAKNGEARHVDFNDKLERHLKGMRRRRAPDSEWLFPSPQRGDRDASTKTFMETLRMAREKSGLANFGFHDCRHFFISFAVMSGIDYMTVAKWAGHKDGGVLIGKVYGHLAAEHSKQQAQKLNFGPTVVRLPNAAAA